MKILTDIQIKKQNICGKIPKDKPKILKIWNKAMEHYEKTKQETTIKEKLRGAELIQYNRNKIVNLALKDYGYKDFSISVHYSEFWDFLHFWLIDVGIADDGKWNEMGDFKMDIFDKYTIKK